MKRNILKHILRLACCTAAMLASYTPPLRAQNPVIRDQFTADPTARVFGDRLYLYPSHDIVPPEGQRSDWFCMADYHVFSSTDLREWTDHGVILRQEDVPWGRQDAYSMWAPDCVCRDGRYYLYFPDAPRDGYGFAIGVAVAERPEGPFRCEAEPLRGVTGIDPCVLLDDDGSAYIYWSSMGLRGARLGADMVSVEGGLQEVTLPRRDSVSAPLPPVLMAGTAMEGLPEGFKEGPFAFKRGGMYYLTFPWVRRQGGTETLAYAMSHSPLGPWDFKGIIMAEHANGCWTNHHSLVEYRGQWYLFYHHNDLSPADDKRRSVCIDRVTFRADGTIDEVIPTNGDWMLANQPRRYFTPVARTAAPARPDPQGFIHRWALLEPIRQDIRSNVVFTDTWLRQTFGRKWFEGQLTVLPKDGQRQRVGDQKLRWHHLDSEAFNVRLFRFAERYGAQTYGSLFWGVTVIDSPREMTDVRLAAGSNGASMWWLNSEEVLLLEGDRRMVEDDGMSPRITLRQGRNILRCAVVNGPGLSDFCVRLLNADGHPLTDYTIVLQ